MQMGDIDFSGKNKLMVGTYGQELLIYKEQESATEPTEKEEKKKDSNYVLFKQLSFAQPIMCLLIADMNNDGIDNLIVVTYMGVHILMPEIEAAKKKILNTLETLKEIRELEVKIEHEKKNHMQLQSEINEFEKEVKT
eukprot:TRINITY_DN22866_c0_g1_i1.p3 TRINITY_DN22866_c0_g1~~TRINITY_DN22866_c0_g1_i1.p3  ORF type:complete len:138 (+),score=56.49 TRINITY_DN22866_c0_g1_i1:1136-1549(+)